MNQPCTVLISSDGKLSSIDIATLRADLESKDIQKKRNAVKSAIIQMSNGKDMSDLLMTVIRFFCHVPALLSADPARKRQPFPGNHFVLL